MTKLFRLFVLTAVLFTVLPVWPSAAAVAADPVGRRLEGIPSSTEMAESEDATTAAPQQRTASGAERTTRQPRRSRALPTPIPFSMVGFELPDGSEVEFRTSVDGVQWSGWELAERLERDDGPDPGSAEQRTATDHRSMTEPQWVDDAQHLQLRVSGGLPEDVAVHLIDAKGTSRSLGQRTLRALGRAWEQGVSAAPAEASAGPPVVTRAGWGANEGWRRGSSSSASTLRAATVHHTAGGNTYTRADAPAVVRGIYHYHTQSLGWNDVGYNALVDRYGTIYEGRHGGLERAVIGAHAGGFNTGTFGIAVMGEFTAAAPPAAALRSLEAMLAWKLALHGVDPNGTVTLTSGGSTRFSAGTQVNLPTVFGHRQVSATACPGDAFSAALGGIRTRTAALVKPAPSPPPVVRSTSTTVAVVGDWNGDGTSTPGWFSNGRWVLRDSNSAGTHDRTLTYGRAGDTPVVGDWNGNGRDGIGVRRGNRWYLRNSTTATPGTDHWLDYGRATDTPVVGDWNGDGRDGIGVHRNARWFLRSNLANVPQTTHQLDYGRAGDTPVAGDWNGNGRDGIGVRRGNRWYLRNSLATTPGTDHWLDYGRATDTPVVGSWNGDGRDGIGVVRNPSWYLRNNLRNEPETFLSYRYSS